MNSPRQKDLLFCHFSLSKQLQENQAVLATDEDNNPARTEVRVKRCKELGVMRQLGFTLWNGSIRRKIGAGYSLCVAIAILGTSMGLMLGEHYQSRALAQMTRAHQQENLLKDLQLEVLRARSHASRFAVVLGNRVWLQYEREGFKQSINKAKQLLTQTKSFAGNPDKQTLMDFNELEPVLKRYALTLDAYSRLTEFLLEEIDPLNLKPEEIEPAQRQLLRNSSGEVAISLDRLSRNLSQLVQVAQTQQQQASLDLKHAGMLRARIIASSMLLSVAIAAVLAWYTSNAIVQPIRSVTDVAHQVAEQSNFTLRAPIRTYDEVGLLATSLNHLIQRIAAYTHELKQAEAQLIQTEKMSSLGAMVAGVAHEINNPVNFIYGNLDYTSEYIQDLLVLVHLYQQHYPAPDPEITEQLDTIDFNFLAEDLPKILSSMKGGAERIRQIVLSLRNFSRIDETGIKQVNIHEGIDNVLLILNNRLKKGIQVIKQYGNLPLLECSPAQLNQVFMNLLCNAVDALEDGHGEESSNYQLPTIRIRTEVAEPNGVTIRIADNGSGIPPTIKDRIFDPFFSTKEPGKGTGLGLTVCYQIITQHQGKIEVNSAPAQGAEFVITLPIKTSK